MKTIFKYILEVANNQSLGLPVGAKILSVQNQYDTITLWAEVDAENITQERKFTIVGTGHPLPTNTKAYLGSVQITGFVWHVYEILN